MIRNPDQRVGVFIDTQNMYHSARHIFKRKVSFKNVVADAVGNGKLIRAMAYVIRTKTAEEAPFIDALKKAGIETREKDLLEYLSGAKKADWDVGLTVDVVRMLDMLDVVVIVSGDGDFVPLVEYCQSRGRIVEVMAFRETTSSRLSEAADGYTNLSENRRRYLLAGPPLPERTEKAPAGAEPVFAADEPTEKDATQVPGADSFFMSRPPEGKANYD